MLRIPINREQTSSYHSVINAPIVLGTVWKSMENRYNFEVFLLDLKYMLRKLFSDRPLYMSSLPLKPTQTFYKNTGHHRFVSDIW